MLLLTSYQTVISQLSHLIVYTKMNCHVTLFSTHITSTVRGNCRVSLITLDTLKVILIHRLMYKTETYTASVGALCDIWEHDKMHDILLHE